MPTLLVFYLLQTGHIHFAVVAAIVFSWAGDALLIQKEKPLFFRLGLVAFLLSHVFYIIAFLDLAGSFNYIALVISAVVAIPLTIIILKKLNAPKPMKIPVAVYASAIMLMSMVALQLMLAWPFFPAILIFAASIVYIYSDSSMAYLLFNKKPKNFNVVTMIPYIIAQGGIIMGLVLGFG
ncbi:MAG: lysoplasmalogenase [Coriobacteriia bacterium]|nr:lysoplasmalogenase [Coriobacteriia bacterium]